MKYSKHLPKLVCPFYHEYNNSTRLKLKYMRRKLKLGILEVL